MNQSNRLSLWQGISTMIKSSVGVGFVMLPAAMACSGMIPGVVLLLVCCLIATISLIFLARLSELSPEIDNYVSLSKVCYGDFGVAVVSICQFLYFMTPLIAYVKLNGEFLSEVIQYFDIAYRGSLLANPAFLSIVTTMLFVLPLCFLKSISSLVSASTLGLACIVYITGLAIIDYLVDLLGIGSSIHMKMHDVKMFEFGIGWFTAFNVFVMSYSNHFSALSVFKDLESPTIKRKNLVIYLTQISIFILYLCVTLFGYLHFGSANLIYKSMLSAKDTGAYLLAQLLMAVCNIVTFPLIHFQIRISLDWLVSKLFHLDQKQWVNARHYGETLFIVFLVTLLALVFESVLGVFDLFVPIVGSVIVFVFPAICLLRERRQLAASAFEIVGAVLLLISSAIILSGMPSTVIGMIKG